MRYVKAHGETRYLDPILAHFGDKPLSEIDQEAVEDAAVELYPAATAQTRNRQVFTPVSAILKHAGIKRPFQRPKGWRGSRRVDWLWPEQAIPLIQVAEEKWPEFGILLTVMLYTGLRLTEALSLEVDKVRLTEEFAYVPDTKNGEPRSVYLPPVVVAALARHPRGMDRPGARVFRYHKSGRLYELLDKAATAAGVVIPPDVAFHIFRHSWATWMRRFGGLDTSGLVATGAWRDRTSAARYEHVVVNEDARRAAMLPTTVPAKSVEKAWKPFEKAKKDAESI